MLSKSKALVAAVAVPLKRMESSPAMSRALDAMDSSVRFMAGPDYTPCNSALAAVRVPLKVGLWIVLALAAIILVWGSLAPIESATVATGKVMLLSSKKTVQHLEGGIINAILVKEGDRVKAGQPLIRLSDTAAAASRDALQAQLFAARAAEARLVAERDNKPRVTFDKDMMDGARSNGELAKTMAAQVHLFESERAAQSAKLAVLNQRIAQSREQIEGLKSQVTGASGQLDLYSEEIGTVEKLLSKGYATKTRLFDLQRSQSELQGNRGQYQAEIAKAEQNIAETQMSVIDQQKEFDTKIAQDLRDTQTQVADLRDKLRAARDVAARTVITAPSSGIVTGLKYHTAGGVIAPGTPIMDIVPQDDQLVIEARIKPTDIAEVHAGEQARVIFTAYKMRTTPKVPGTVTLVSADSFTEEEGGKASSYYTARIEVDKRFLQKLATPIDLQPGMPAEIMIRTGSRSFLGYLFKPLTDSTRRAFREQ